MEKYLKMLEQNNWLTADEIKKLFAEELTDEIKKCNCPKQDEIFNAFDELKPEDVKVLIIGQDPYPNKHDAHGLAFSSKANETPKSLKRIFAEIEKEFGACDFKSNDLTCWKNQGVLLLNSALTLCKNTDDDLRRRIKLWKPFVSAIIRKLLTSSNKPLVVMLWGDKAKNVYKHGSLKVDKKRNILVLESYHPQARISAEDKNSFVNCGHFKKCNNFLEVNNAKPIEWRKTF